MKISARSDLLDRLHHDLHDLQDFAEFWNSADQDRAEARHALASPDTIEAGGDADNDSSACEATAPSATKRSQRKPPKFSSTHKRQQHEKRTLNEQVRAYEARRRELERARTARAASLAMHTDALREGQRVSTEQWKAVAKDQRGQLTRARYENNQLRLRVLEERKLARRLHRMLSERASNYAIQSAALLSRIGAVDLSRGDHAALTHLLSSLGGMIASARSTLDVLEHSAPSSGSHRSWRLRANSNQRCVIEVIDCEELPYHRKVVDAALERITRASGVGRRELSAEPFGGPAGTVVEEELSRTSDGLDNFRYRRAHRMFVDDARTVVFSSGRIERVDEGGCPLPGFACEIQIWILRTQRRHACELTGVPRVSSVTQRFFAIAPIAARGSSTPPNWTHDELHTQLLPLLDREISRRLQRFENALVAAN